MNQEKVFRIGFKKRTLSEFVARELLYDYLTDKLDKSRKQSMQDILNNSQKAQIEMARIIQAIQYSERLGQTKIASAVSLKITESRDLPFLIKNTFKFEKMSPGFKWATEAIGICVLTLVLVLVVPWKRMLVKDYFQSQQPIILAQIDKTPKTKTDSFEKPIKMDKAEFEDEIPKTAITQAPVKPTAKALPSPAKPEPTVAAAVGAEASKKPSEGFLFRGELNVTNLEAVGPKIREKIIDLGGRKAGEVELGWRKSNLMWYFHFTIPEAKYSELNEFLSTYGKSKINKEKHPRIMPEGIVRIILSVNEANN